MKYFYLASFNFDNSCWEEDNFVMLPSSSVAIH